MSLAARVKERRLELGWNQAELSRQAKVSRTTVAAIESRRRTSLQAPTMLKLERALGIELRDHWVEPTTPRPDLITAPWDDVEMRFAMMSVLMAARIWHAKPGEPEAINLLHSATALCDDQLRKWNERAQ